jgi:hypothetical protein
VSNDYDPVERDADVQAAFNLLTQTLDFNAIAPHADFVITATFDGENPFDLVGPILRAGHKMEFNGHQCFVVEDSDASYYFVGRKDAVIEKLRKLAADDGTE